MLMFFLASVLIDVTPNHCHGYYMSSSFVYLIVTFRQGYIQRFYSIRAVKDLYKLWWLPFLFIFYFSHFIKSANPGKVYTTIISRLQKFMTPYADYIVKVKYKLLSLRLFYWKL